MLFILEQLTAQSKETTTMNTVLRTFVLVPSLLAALAVAACGGAQNDVQATTPTNAQAQSDIVDTAATSAGRNTADIESCVTVAGELPDSDEASEQWLQRLAHLGELGVTYFVMDFGHPLAVEPALRFAEQVIAPMKA